MNEIVLILLLVLLFVKNLGKKTSFIICGVIFAIKAVIFILCVTTFPGALFNGDVLGSAYNFKSLAGLTLAAVTGICTYAKYVDKDERNTY